jgi:hypothetical protein
VTGRFVTDRKDLILSEKQKSSNFISTRWALVLTAYIVCAASAPKAAHAQQNGPQNQSPASPGGGITSGTAAIETTLFAYRSLSSDSEGISREVLALTNTPRKIVIGTTSDLAAFAQWRGIMSEALLLDQRARRISADFPNYPAAGTPTPLSTLSVTETHTAGNLTQRQTIMFTLAVSNTSGSDSAAVPLTVLLSLPTGWFLTNTVAGAPQGYKLGPPMGGAPGTNWTCTPSPDRNSIACTRNDSLQAFSTYQLIVVYATVGAPPPASSPAPVATVTLIGGGAVPPAPLTATLPIPAAAAAGGGRAAGAVVPGGAPAGPQSPPTTSGGGGAGALSALTGAIPVFATVLGQAFAVQQTLSASQSSMTDTPLIRMVGEKLREGGVRVLIPSDYSPYLLRNGTLEDTYLWQVLVQLETDRAVLWNDLANASKVLSKETYIIQNPTKYNAGDVTTALEYSGKLQSLMSSAQAVASSIDSFETSLFGAQATPQPAQQAQNPQNQSTNSPGGQTTTGNTGGNPTGNQPNTPPANQGNGPTGNPAGPTTPNQGPQSPPAGGQATSLLPQILGADLLAHALWDDPAWVTPSDQAAARFNSAMDKVNFLTLHALESGGSELNKSNFFYGTHIFFSGGSVATFGLYKVSGEVRCSGFAYDYEGNVREKKYDRALRLPQLPAIVTLEFSSCQPEEGSREITLRRGMTAPEAFEAARVPYRTVAVTNDSYTYEFDDLNRTRIVIRDGVVTKVMKTRQ